MRFNHSKNLIDQCIEPTEENPQKYQEEVNALVRELQKKYPPKPIPVIRSYLKTLVRALRLELKAVLGGLEMGTTFEEDFPDFVFQRRLNASETMCRKIPNKASGMPTI